MFYYEQTLNTPQQRHMHTDYLVHFIALITDSVNRLNKPKSLEYAFVFALFHIEVNVLFE